MKEKSIDKANEDDKPTSAGSSGVFERDNWSRKGRMWLLPQERTLKEDLSIIDRSLQESEGKKQWLRQRVWVCVTGDEIVVSTNNIGLHDYDVLCDNQASVSIFHNKTS